MPENESTGVAIVRRGYKAFSEADFETPRRLFDPQASWHTPGRSALGIDRRGRDAVFAQFARYSSGTDGGFRLRFKTCHRTCLRNADALDGIRALPDANARARGH
ncbi:MAG: nuclear transport factor 2 family protein [Caldimonas sp.]